MESYGVAKIICPQCSAELDPAADHCDHCGAATRCSAPQEVPAVRPRLLERPWMMTIILLHLGIFGIPVYWKTGYSRATRLGLVVVSIVYTIFVAIVVIWGVSQIIRAVQDWS